MVRFVLSFFLLVSLISAGYSQQAAKDTLSIHDGFFGMSYQMGARDISSGEFRDILRSNPDTAIYQLYSSGSAMGTIADVLGFAGGFGLGYGLTAKPSKAAIAVAGGVVAAAGLVFNIEGKSKMREAVAKYNQHERETESHSDLYEFDRRYTLVAISVRF